ncbi:ABC transporter ATP-binding protein [Bacteroidia bacterium]|nr:ABC transporter ATP-binding protein [Bacteroidia bacterium]
MRIDPGPGVRLMKVYVEGYGDVAFWRTIFNHYESPTLRFEIGVPYRADMAKGKQTLLKMYQELEPDREDVLLCMDSDFDYLFNSVNRQSYVVNHAPNIFHTYAYAFENYLCYAPSLHNVCVKSTKNDVRIFDFEHFLTEFSKTVYPLFLWYAHAALSGTENYFPLIDFRTSVKINYLDLADNGRNTIEWLARQVEKRIDTLTGKYPSLLEQLPQFEKDLRARGVAPENAYLYMQGHTLMDNVVMVALNAVCEQLKLMVGNNIASSQMTGQTLRNEMSNYSNELRNVRDTLLDNENYKDCFLYLKLRSDIETYLAGVV